MGDTNDMARPADRVLSPSATEPRGVSAHSGDAPSRDEVFGIECAHHYGITTHPLPAHGDAGKEVYRLIREAWHAPREGGGGLHDGDHSFEVALADKSGCWSRVIIRKNAKSPPFALKPSWCDDGPGALWFSQEFRVVTRADINREIDEKHGLVARWQRQADEQRDTIRGRKARQKYNSLARSAAVEASLIRSRWPQYDGTARTGWQERMHCHRDSDRNPEGEDRNGLRAEPESAGREPASPNPQQEPQQ